MPLQKAQLLWFPQRYLDQIPLVEMKTQSLSWFLINDSHWDPLLKCTVISSFMILRYFDLYVLPLQFLHEGETSVTAFLHSNIL